MVRRRRSRSPRGPRAAPRRGKFARAIELEGNPVVRHVAVFLGLEGSEAGAGLRRRRRRPAAAENRRRPFRRSCARRPVRPGSKPIPLPTLPHRRLSEPIGSTSVRLDRQHGRPASCALTWICSGRTPRTTSRPAVGGRRRTRSRRARCATPSAADDGRCAVRGRACPETKFIAGEPTKPATKRFDRPVVDLLRRGELLDDAAVHHRDAVGERQRLDLVVGDVDHGVAELLVQPLDLDPQLGAELGVEVGQRLVEEEHIDVAHQRPADRDALALAAGELRRACARAAARSAGAPRPA